MSNTGFFNTGLNIFYAAPDPSNVTFVRSVVVDDGVDFSYNPDGPPLFTIDIGENSIDIVFLENVAWDAAAFNGIQIADQSENLISLASVADVGSTVGGFTFQFDADNLFVNWQGLSFQAGDEIHLTVGFAVATPPVATDSVALTDEDTPLDFFVPAATDEGPVHYVLDSTVSDGELTFNSDGTYSFDPAGAFDYLAAGESPLVPITFDYHAVDQDGAQSEIVTISITVTGVNDAPVLAPDAVRLAASVAVPPEEPAGEQVATFLSGVSDVDTGAFAGIAITGIGGAGVWQYLDGVDWTAFSASDAAALLLASTDYIRFVPTDPLATDNPASITYHAWDQTGSGVAGGTADLTPGTGGTSAFSTGTATASITLNSTNNEPTIGGTSTGNVTEDGSLTTGGALSIVDIDPNESTFIPQALHTATYGIFTLTDDGTWTYTVDNANAAVQALGASGTLADSFTAVSFDGSATKIVTVTIHGANDVPTVRGTTAGDVTEDDAVNVNGKLTANGALTIADPDNGQSTFAPQTAFAGFYGTFTLNVAGAWTYAVTNNQIIVQGLGATGTLNDSLTAWSSDGSQSEVVTVTIHGANDAAAIGGVADGDVTEDVALDGGGNLTTGGSLTVSDADTGQANFTPQTSVPGTYGTFNLTAGGAWTYSIGNAAVQALGATDTLSDSFTAVSSDGSDNQLVTVTIHGADDDAVIGGEVAGDVTEDTAVDGGGNLAAGGTLTISDVDTGEDSFVAQSSVAGIYGIFTLTTGGVWTYTASNSDPGVQGLGAGDSTTDTFTAASNDGSDTQVVTVTIHGLNDDASIGGVADDDVTEDTALDGGGNLTAGGTLTIADADAGEATFVAQSSVGGDYGTFTLTAGGVWTYSVANGLAAVQAVAAAATLTDSFVAASTDGSDSQTVTVTVHGLNDAPVAVADTGAAAWDEIKSFDVLADDSDADAGDTKTLSALGAIVVTSADADIDGIDATAAFSIVGNQIRFDPGVLFSLLDHALSATVVVDYTMEDSQDVSASSTLTLTLSGLNHTPVITYGGGGASAAASVAENQTNVATVTATDSDVGDVLQFALVGGADAGKFVIDANTGALAFATGPNFEAPGDADGNNVYSVVVRASDGTLNVDQTINVTVANVVGVTVAGTKWNDLVDASHGIGGLFATVEEDYLVGRNGNDILRALAGNDIVNGGLGKNTLFGGPDRDTFIFNTKLGFGKLGVPAGAFTYAKIPDFSVFDDTIDLSRAIFKPLQHGILKKAAFYKGAAAHDASDHIVYNPKNGALLYDFDGKGGFAGIQFATLPAHLALTNADFFVL